jgi:exodeoxyribonuclease V alpha subunit
VKREMLFPGGSAQARLRPDATLPPALLELLRDHDLDDGRAFLAWQLGQMASELGALDRNAFMLVCARLLVAEGQGSTRLALTEQDRMLLAAVPDLVGAAEGHTPLVLDQGHLYTRRAFACESRLVAAAAQRLTRPGPFATRAIEQALRDAEATVNPPPSAQQKAAVATSLQDLLGVISGGPGTGKTTTALTLVRCLVRLGVPAARIALCAPTGKAASRMEDDFRRRLGALTKPDLLDAALLRDCPKAQTLHRLLGITSDPTSLYRTADEPLPFRAVIVDESSMVDLVLMDRLLAALPASTPLVLLGDADQLPSVGAGSVFLDLGAHATRLEHGFRTGGSGAAGQAIATLAAAIRAGDVATANRLAQARVHAGALCHEGVESLPRDTRGELLRHYHQRHFDGDEVKHLSNHVYRSHDGGFDPTDVARLDALATCLARSRILTVTRERATGSVEVNALLHDLHGGGLRFLPGEPVLMLRNDYRRALWNGDQGVAIVLQRPGRPAGMAVAFRTRAGWQAVDPDAMGGALAHGYALTAHKSQGSEFDEVVLLLPDFACPILTRELLYTAVSRARRGVVLCGAPEMVDQAITTKELRNSGIAARLATRMTEIG